MVGKTFPALPAYAQPAILCIWQEAHEDETWFCWSIYWSAFYLYSCHAACNATFDGLTQGPFIIPCVYNEFRVKVQKGELFHNEFCLPSFFTPSLTNWWCDFNGWPCFRYIFKVFIKSHDRHGQLMASIARRRFVMHASEAVIGWRRFRHVSWRISQFKEERCWF